MAESKSSVFECLSKNGLVAKGKNIKIKKFLTLEEQIAFCDSVTRQVFAGGVYTPAVYDFALRFATLIFFTDIEIEDPETEGISEKLNTVLYQGRVVEYIRERVNPEQYSALMVAASSKVEYMVKESLSSGNLLNKIAQWISKLGTEVNSFLSNEEVVSLIEKLSNMEEKDIVRELTKYLKSPEENK